MVGKEKEQKCLKQEYEMLDMEPDTRLSIECGNKLADIWKNRAHEYSSLSAGTPGSHVLVEIDEVPVIPAPTEQDFRTQHAETQKTTRTSYRFILELQKYIMLLASMIATVTYAAGFTGDVWKDTAADHIIGDPILRDTNYKRYMFFYYCNSTAFAASLVINVLVLSLGLASLDTKDNNSSSRIVRMILSLMGAYKNNPTVTVRLLQVAMVVDLLGLMGAYAAGTCQDTFTTVYFSVLVGFFFFYVIVQVTVASCFTDTGSGGMPDGQVEERHPVPDDAPASLASGTPNSGSGSGVLEPEAVEKKEEWLKPEKRFRMVIVRRVASVHNKVEQDKANKRFRRVLLLLATFAVSITYMAGLSMPGGFWDSDGAGHHPGDAILKDHHNTRLVVFFGFNTLAFVASLLIIVVVLDTKPHHRLRHWFIVIALFSLIAAYNAGSCRHTDTTVYVFSLIPAVLVYILFLYFVAHPRRYAKWERMKKIIRDILLRQRSIPSTWNGRMNTNGRVREAKTEKQKAADKARSLVLLLATLAATITYQAGLHPPGGFWQDNNGGHTAGDPILMTTNPRRFKAFFYCNSVSLVASLVAIVLVRKKHLLRHHALEEAMILDLLGLIGAYVAGSWRDVKTSIPAMALAGAILVYVVISIVFFTLDDDTRTRSEGGKKKDKELVEKTRKRLLLFAILVATTTYQAGLTPPGGVLLQDDQPGHQAGDPVLLFNSPRRYKAFFYCNSVSFMLSIALIIALVNPNLYRPALRTHKLSVCMAVGLFGLMGAYAAGCTRDLKTSIYIYLLVAVVISSMILLLFMVFWFTDCSNSNATTGTSQEPAGRMENVKDDIKKKKRVHAKRKYLMLLGILVASVTYKAGLEPPGGAWQSSSGGYKAGNPVMHDNRRTRYLAFFYSNSTSFMASIVVIFLLLVLDKKPWYRRWLVVTNTTIVLDLLGLLVAYAAGSSRQWKTSVDVMLLVIAVLAYMAFHLLLTLIRIRNGQRAEPRAIDTPSV